jgi:formylmethanofuran dehydrogenase subunit E
MTTNGISEELLEAKKFHGHLGPYLAIGIRMGKLFCATFGDKPFSFRTFTSVGLIPPISCVIDGLQISTPGTIGNSMIKVEGEGDVAAWVEKDGKKMVIRLRDEQRSRIDTITNKDNEEQLSAELMETPAAVLFTIETYAL